MTPGRSSPGEAVSALWAEAGGFGDVGQLCALAGMDDEDPEDVDVPELRRRLQARLAAFPRPAPPTAESYAPAAAPNPSGARPSCRPC